MAVKEKARQLVVFAAVLFAGTSLLGVCAEAHSKKASHHTQASAHHSSSHRVASHGGHTSGKTLARATTHGSHKGSRHTVASASSGSSHGGMQKVRLVIRKHGRTFVRTVWRPRDRHWRQLADNVYASGAYWQCVPYARQVSGIALTGNAYTWWDEASGRYARGHSPEAGSILNFRRNGRMQLGHVAVVTNIVSPREVLITQANWGGPGFTRGGISKNISVVDVSPRNDWTAVRMALGHSSDYGSIYPTYGFIYGHGSDSTRIADATVAAPPIAIGNNAPADLRTRHEKAVATPFTQTIQFASAPAFDGPAIATSAPDRSIR